MSMLHTVTLSPGYDDYYTVTGLDWGGIGQLEKYHSVPSGKGVSCARTAVALGIPVRAHVLIGDDGARGYGTRLAAESIPHRLVTVPGGIRHNLTLIDGTGEQVAAHFMGERLRADGLSVVAPLMAGLMDDVEAGDVVSLNGSLAQGLPDETWADFARACVSRGAKVIVDAQSGALRAALEVPGLTAFKPNDEEIRALPGLNSLDRNDRVARALTLLAETGVGIPLVSLGADGVAVLRDGEPFILTSPVDRPVASVMAGDAFVAGLAWGLLGGAAGEDAVRRGLAAAAAHVSGLTGGALLADAQHRVGVGLSQT